MLEKHLIPVEELYALGASKAIDLRLFNRYLAFIEKFSTEKNRLH